MNHDNSRSGNCMTAVAVLLLLLLMVALASSGIRKICTSLFRRILFQIGMQTA